MTTYTTIPKPGNQSYTNVVGGFYPYDSANMYDSAISYDGAFNSYTAIPNPAPSAGSSWNNLNISWNNETNTWNSLNTTSLYTNINNPTG